MAGLAIAGSAHSFGQGVAGLAISGAGAGIGELTALSGYVAGLCRLKNMLMFVQNCRTRSSQTAWPVPFRNCCLLVAFHPVCLVRPICRHAYIPELEMVLLDLSVSPGNIPRRNLTMLKFGEGSAKVLHSSECWQLTSLRKRLCSSVQAREQH
jgi:hypothetical protein